jgi:hypothetical protein
MKTAEQGVPTDAALVAMELILFVRRRKIWVSVLYKK